MHATHDDNAERSQVDSSDEISSRTSDEIGKRIERFGHDKIRLVECPVCGVGLRNKKTAHHIEKHSPSDFGLTGGEVL